MSRLSTLGKGLTASIAPILLIGCSSKEQQAMRETALAQQQMEAGQIAAARRSMARAVSYRDDIAQVQLLRGQVELAAGSRETAFAAFSQAMTLDATNVSALQGVAQLGLLTNRVEEAELASDRLLALDPRDSVGLMTRGLLQLVRNKLVDASATADRLIAAAPTSEMGALLKARALLLQGQRDDAIAIIAKASGQSRSSAPLQLMELEIARDQDDAARMLQAFDRLRASSPNDPDLRIDEANLRYKIGDARGARALIAPFLSAKGLDRDRAEQVAALFREYDPAPLSDAQLGDLGRDGGGPAIEAVGNFLIDAGRFDSAWILVNAAQPDAFSGFKARIAALKREPGALAATQGVLAADRTDCQALLALATLKLDAGRAGEAVTPAQNAQAQCPELIGGWLVLARVYEATRNLAGARRAYEQALAVNPRQSFAAGAYADWLIAHKQRDRALAIANKLTQSAPALNSGWALYRKVALAAGAADQARLAEAGSKRAGTLLGVDLAPGAAPAHGVLFARLRAS